MGTLHNHDHSTIAKKEKVMRIKGLKWKGALVAIAGLAAVAGSTPSASAALCGDLNNDGKLTVADAVKLQRAIFTPNPADCGGAGSGACGDTNPSDGDVLGVGDVVALLANLAGNPTLYALCTGPGNVIACPGPGATGAGGESWTGQATVTGNITQSQIWPAGCRVNVDGLTFVQPGVTVTMQPGVLVVGKNPPSQNGGPTNVSALIFLRGSRINAASDATHAPILMTSSDHVDNNTGHIGDWGGLTLNGSAPVNCPGGECLAEGLVGVPFGGANPHDSSGVMEFVRVEFSGRELTPDNELNIITLNGVGDGTIYDHVQANVGFDDCQEWFGGTVNGKYLVSSGCGDDMFDQQLGTTGKMQYGLGLYYQPLMQNAGNEGIEWDDNENGFDLLPRSAPKYCNVTIAGTALQTSVGLGGSEGALTLRRGTAGIIANTIVMDFRLFGMSFRDNATAAQACTNSTTLAGNLLVEHSLFYNNGFTADGAVAPDNTQVESKSLSSPTCTGAQYWGLLAASKGLFPADPTTIGPNPQIPLIYGTPASGAQTNLDQFIPAGAAGVATEPTVNLAAMDCKAIDPSFYDTTTWVGAFKPGDTSANWLTTPWISLRLH